MCAIVWGDYWKSMHLLVAQGKWDTFKNEANFTI